jgi:hypothetical protein
MLTNDPEAGPPTGAAVTRGPTMSLRGLDPVLTEVVVRVLILAGLLAIVAVATVIGSTIGA